MFYLTSLVIGLLLVLPYRCKGQAWCTGTRRECTLDSATEICDWVSSRNAYYCECKDGYRLNEDLVCEDIDECEWNVCGSRTCVNSAETYDCKWDGCNEGFLRESISDPCYDIDECKFPVCGPSGTCENYAGLYRCRCYSGYYIGSYGRCYDTDECTTTPDICVSSAGQCVNTPGSYRCECDTGYILIDNKCTDTDECTTNPNICGSSSAGLCVDTPGSYRCECYTGYILIDNKCTDIDECSNSYICGSPSAGQCNNTDGWYTCQCYDGYQLTNNSCDDLDECKNSTCDDNAECTNFLGGYNCSCTTGFSGDGESCTAVPSPSPLFDKPGVIAGTVVGILGVAVVTFLLVIFIRRRSRRENDRNKPLTNQQTEPQPSYVNVEMSDVRSQENQPGEEPDADSGVNNVEDLYANKLVKERKQRQRELAMNTVPDSADVVYANEANGSGAVDPYDVLRIASAYNQNPHQVGSPDNETYNLLHQRPLEIPSSEDGREEVNLYNHLYVGGEAPQARGNPLPGREILENGDTNEYSLADK